MSCEKRVAEHYAHGSLLGDIRVAITKMGKTVENLTLEDLAAVDEFHIGGRVATDHLLDQLNFSETNAIIDVGCGLGGASRHIAGKYHNRVTGIDLTQEYIEVGNVLCSWVGLAKQVDLFQGSALSMPFEDRVFDGAIMLHVGMNIEDKHTLFSEVYRILSAGAYFGVYDVMRLKDGELRYPVPWASDISTSRLASINHYKRALSHAGFELFFENSRREFALEFFNQMQAKTRAAGGPPPMGLHLLMQESTSAKFNNLVENIKADLVAPVEIIVRKPE